MSDEQHPVEALLPYTDSEYLDSDYVAALIDQVRAEAHEQARDRLVKTVWAQMQPLGNGVNPAYYGGWNAGIAAAVDTIKGAYLGTCAKCRGALGYVNAPTGGGWAHETRPDDNHDAIPAR